MVAEKASRRFTPVEYLALERQAEYKSEFYDGHIVAHAGVRKEYDRIALDVYVSLLAQLRDGPCDVFTSAMRVGSEAAGRYTYPDTTVVCGEPQFEDDHFDTLLNPTVIVEVLSPSTEAYDRGARFAFYRRIASLREYLLIAQDRPSVEHYLRREEGWLLTAVTDLDGVIHLPSIGCELPLHAIYRRVPFAGEPSS